ncbi:SPOSA6832_03620 [Sporobolomyces salmonicolor]|uniref:SPOSA6832_03620-mRNA-1:cds n=1 Tax=Sporidiobolus salmonicolor TaxID=5005 RepID=A0A0D6EPZ3_SPOSA|nr:SPOSA6832_03620 [Sporobolomyces salmonicolor]
MSLYGGISFSGKKPAPESDTPAAPSTPAQPQATLSSSASPAPADPPADDKPKPAAWSAALRFAPTVRKKPSTPASRPSAAALKSAFSTADDDTPAPSSSNLGPRIAARGKASLSVAPPKAPPPSKWSAVSTPVPEVFAARTETAPSASPRPATPSSRATSIRIRRVIAIPPSMTLDDDLPSAAGTDVNGFQATAVGKKAAQQQAKKGKRRGKGGGGNREDPALAYTDVPYDPARPCDYVRARTAAVAFTKNRRTRQTWRNASHRRAIPYKTHVRLMRAQRRLEREEEERRHRRREGSESGSSYYSSDEDDRKTTKKARLFAPPPSYDGPPSAAASSFPPPFSYDPPSAPSRDETADEAYARRVALSNPVPVPRQETGEEAYERRMAMSAAPGREETGEEAYQRRIALSRGAPPSAAPTPPALPQAYPPSPLPPSFVPPSFVPPSFVPPSFVPPSFVPPSFVLPSESRPTYPAPPPGFIAPPSFASPLPPSDSTSFPPFRPPQPTAPPAADSTELSPALDAAQAKAREIAARLSRLGGGFAAPPPSAAAAAAPQAQAPTLSAPVPDNRTFAERMMSKYGWESGKGLGAAESGMTTALSVSRAPAVTASSSKKKVKKKDADPPPPAAPTGMASRSVVVDSSRSTRLAEQAAQMGGEASRVVLLTNLCGANEVDEDLPGEIAEEANKIGVVERCFVYIVPGETRDEEAVRVFLVMSGLAGGYNAVRSFDGRFFGGRTVKARCVLLSLSAHSLNFAADVLIFSPAVRFYDEKAFNAGEHLL